MPFSKIRIYFSCILLLLSFKSFAQLSVSGLKCEYNTSPAGLQTTNPNFSWLLNSKHRSCRQTAYRVIVSDDIALIGKNTGNTWDSKRVVTCNSIQIKFNGEALLPAKTYYWKVMVWNNRGDVSQWSKAAKWQMGLLSTSDWNGAKWIGYDILPDSQCIVPAIDNPGDSRWNKGADILPLMRKPFTVKKQVKSATVFISGLGQFDISLNGEKVGDHFMDPGWTKYDKRALYVTFDITDKLKPGDNTLGIMLGNGFYYIPGERYHKLKSVFGYPKMICRLHIIYQDGTEDNIVSDGSWKTTPGPVTFSSIYGGEDYDANLEKKGWDMIGYDDSGWKHALITSGPKELDAQTEEPLKIFENFSVKKITQPKPGVWIYDLGQNASAIPFITVRGKKGAVIKITPSELLDDNGLATQNAIGSPVFFNYTLKGGTTESWQPQFMYYGFRYLQIEGGTPVNEANPGALPVIEQIKSLHTRNAAAKTGDFSCSNQLFNKTFSLIDWAIQNNMASILTDCPHREKLGWLEEVHLMGNSIRYNYDAATLLRKLVKDIACSQTADGLIPDIAPEYVQFADGFRDSPEWGSSGIILPYDLYKWYGDKQVLAENYDMMSRYAAYLGKKAKEHILYFGLGDWYDIGPKEPGYSQLTPEGITSTAIYYYDLCTLAKVAHLLNKTADEQAYKDLSVQVKEAYNKTFFNKQTEQYGTGSQTANAISVYVGLADEADKEKVIDNIVKDIRAHNNSITAGDIGYSYLLRVLNDAGRSDVIFDMNSRSDVPGYGYQLAQGATALTESWQANKISSNDHLMLGHLMEWFYSGLGGIKQSESSVAFDHIIIRPEIVGDITYAKASYLSPYGLIANEWERSGRSFIMKTKIPANTTAVIYLPADKNSSITESGKNITSVKDLKFLKFENGKALIEAGSGDYKFVVE